MERSMAASIISAAKVFKLDGSRVAPGDKSISDFFNGFIVAPPVLTLSSLCIYSSRPPGLLTLSAPMRVSDSRN
jgi:hypothetical protein